jgi:DNA-binding NarL/FixJ family response regulator
MTTEPDVRLMIVEDHEMVARGLETALGGEPGIEVVARVGSVADAVTRYGQLRPTVVLMDYRLPDGTGTDATRDIRELDGDATVLLLTGFDDPGVVGQALDAGCSGFVTKDGTIENLVSAIRAVAGGAAVFPAEQLARALRPTTIEPRVGADLTAREREVLALLSEGASTEQIASQLFLSLHTVRNHVRNILTKLQARTKLEAVVTAARAGIVDLSPDR